VVISAANAPRQPHYQRRCRLPALVPARLEKIVPMGTLHHIAVSVVRNCSVDRDGSRRDVVVAFGPVLPPVMLSSLSRHGVRLKRSRLPLIAASPRSFSLSLAPMPA